MILLQAAPEKSSHACKNRRGIQIASRHSAHNDTSYLKGRKMLGLRFFVSNFSQAFMRQLVRR
jgi:hypothetical protein